MAQISFWSIAHGQPGNTSNAVALGAMTGIEYEIHSLITQTHFERSTLEAAFMKSNELQLGRIYEIGDIGLDALARLARSKKLNKESVKNKTISLEENRLDLLIGSQKPFEGLYENLSPYLEAIFNYAREYYHAIFIDLHSGLRNPLTTSLLDSSDLIVVSLCQSRPLLDRFFINQQEWPNALKEKPVMLLLGQYDPVSKYTAANIQRLYRNVYDFKSPIYTIPYCSGFRDAINDKDVLDWFRKNRNVNKKHQNALFIQEVRKAAKAILDNIGVDTQVKLIERGAS
jgi:hypothetical protein